MIRYSLSLLLASLLVSGCRRATIVEGRWNGSDTTLYITLYDDLGFSLLDSLQTHDGEFLWRGKMKKNLVYGISEKREDRHPATFLPDGDTLHMQLWPGGGITTQNSAVNSLLQQTLATDFDADTLIARHADSPVTAYIATRLMTQTLPYDSLVLLRKRITLTKHPYIDELDTTIEEMRNIHPGCYAPPIEGVDLGDSTLVVFHATWCPDCKAEWPHITEYLSAHPATRLVALDIDSIHWNGDLAKAYAVRGVPAIFLVADGKIVRTGL